MGSENGEHIHISLKKLCCHCKLLLSHLDRVDKVGVRVRDVDGEALVPVRVGAAVLQEVLRRQGQVVREDLSVDCKHGGGILGEDILVVVQRHGDRTGVGQQGVAVARATLSAGLAARFGVVVSRFLE